MTDEKTFKNPTLVGIKCPNCGSENYRIEGTGSAGASVGKQLLFGAVGNIVSSSRSKDDFELKPVKYRCLDCKNKYETIPNEASDDEILKKPCTITFERLSSFIGGAVRQQVFLNGIKMGTIKNGSKITFETNTRTNVIFVTDHHGVAFKEHYTFTAKDGGEEYIKFKKKFIK